MFMTNNFLRFFINIFILSGVLSKASMQNYLARHDAAVQNENEYGIDFMKKMNTMMTECYSKIPEIDCLKLLFNASFFWE